MKVEDAVALRFNASEADVVLFVPLLQEGVRVAIRTDCSVADLLHDQFGLTSDYIDSRIKTVFLEGRPVDDFETARVGDGATLALSAAMPGLVGAVFRSGGVLSPFRASITHRGSNHPSGGGDGLITIKLFNLLTHEIGMSFLRHGIVIHPDSAAKFFNKKTDRFWLKCTFARMDGRDIPLNQLPAMNWSELKRPVLLRIEA
jgi:hypothetical protein